MKIHEKTLIITGITTLLVLGAIYIFLYATGSQTVSVSEDANLQNALHQAIAGLNDESFSLDHTIGDWAAWDDTYDFMQTRSDTYIRSNLEDVSLAASHIDLMAFYNVSGEPILIKMVKIQNGAAPQVPPELTSISYGDRLLAPQGALINRSEENHVHGLILLGGKTYALASLPVLTSRGEGPTHGTIMTGKLVSNSTIAALTGIKNKNVNTTLWLVGGEMPPDASALLPELLSSNSSITKYIDDETHIAYSLVTDVYGKPLGVLRVVRLRTEHIQFDQSMLSMLGAFAVVAVFFQVLKFLLLDRFVLSRLKKLEEQTEEIGKGGIETRIQIEQDGGDDEISSLTENINRMLSKLNATQKALLKGQIEYGLRLNREVQRKTAQLSDANKRLRHVEQMKNRFLFSMGHELKSPLAVIEMNTSAILGGKISRSESAESREIIRRNMVRLKQKIEEIIQLTNFEHSRKVSKEKVDLSAMVRESVSTYQDFAKARGVKIHLVEPDRNIEVMGDPRLLLYAIGNLLSNAVKYCDGKDIRVKLHSEGGKAIFTVADEGKGVLKENRHRLFKRFFKEDKSAPGTGVGLFITREIARGHYGGIRYMPNWPSGSVFILSLPLKKKGGSHAKNRP